MLFGKQSHDYFNFPEGMVTREPSSLLSRSKEVNSVTRELSFLHSEVEKRMVDVEVLAHVYRGDSTSLRRFNAQRVAFRVLPIGVLLAAVLKKVIKVI